MSELRLRIGGMHCVNCAGKIEKEIAALHGVDAATVNFASETLHVDYTAATISPEMIAARVSGLGYTSSSLESDSPAGEEARRDLYWLIFSAILTTPVALLMFAGGHEGVGLWISALLATIVQFSAGLTFYTGAWNALRNRSTNMDVLVALGISAAWGYSILALLGFLGPHAHNFFETGAMLVTFIRAGKWLEARARGRASRALRELLTLQPDTARLLRDGVESEVATRTLQIGDLILVKAGERIAVDGVIESGEGAIDEAMLTGEAAPVAKGPGESVSGATINRSGLLTIRATAVGAGTVLSRIVRMVEDAQADKAPIQRLVDKVSSIFVPVVIVLALLTLAGWLLVGAEFVFALQLSIAVVVIACPCALGLATPTAIMVGSSIGLGSGILFKRASALENVARIDTVLFDKTGTLTSGSFGVTDLLPVSGIDAEELLRIALSIESSSTHPLATAVVAHAVGSNFAPLVLTDVSEVGGHGLIAQSEGAALVAGNRRLCEREGIDLSPLAAAEARLAGEGKAMVFIARNQQLLGLIALADTVKPEAIEAIRRLHALGLKTALITGDRKDAAQTVAATLGISEVEAEVLPGDKLTVVRRWQAAGKRVAMVGDGINDAPALAAADIGIAIGSGTDVAKETGDIVLVRGDLLDVERAIRLGRATLSKIRQNLFWAFFYNIVGIPVAAGLLYPHFGLILKPEFAGLAMAFSSVSVVSNSLLLNGIRKKLRG
ncbi:MAG: copper-translocating P-type ATPase [Deltaproteobacteria bacterium HGW-Deltaproteobacteria-4]|nr:MAG: copper-translocating P-type ATPase [Deltaproteobacteria bacterium HGW-Deltaproteobacteria-4]